MDETSCPDGTVGEHTRRQDERALAFVRRYGGPASFNLRELLLEAVAREDRATVEQRLIGYNEELDAIWELIETAMGDFQADDPAVIEREQDRIAAVRLAWHVDALNRRWLQSLREVVEDTAFADIELMVYRAAYPDMFALSPMEYAMRRCAVEEKLGRAIHDVGEEYRDVMGALNRRLGSVLDRRFTMSNALALLAGDEEARARVVEIDPQIDAALMERRRVEREYCAQMRQALESHVGVPADVELILVW